MNEVQERRERVIAHRQKHWTFKRIGEDLGISGTQAQRLYRAGLLHRQKREAQAAQNAATAETALDKLGLDPDVAYALRSMGLRDVAAVIAMDRRELMAKVLRFHNVGKRTLSPLFTLCDRLTALRQ